MDNGSLGYASALSYRTSFGGSLGTPEERDPPSLRRTTLTSLLDAVASARSVVVFTGAGISTAAGVPDFRGPGGVWTRQVAGLPPPPLSTPFAAARPTLTHQALRALIDAGKVSAIVSQNVDNLHRRSGVPRDRLAELHGNCFIETCRRCGAEFERAFEVGTVGFTNTGRRCGECRARLVDWCLDWDSELPAADAARADAAADGADLALALGTSLQIEPANGIPLRTVKAGGRLAIVNLQPTPRDSAASWLIRWPVDDVMAALVQRLGVTLPVYTRKDAVVVRVTVSNGPTRTGPLLATVTVASPAGDGCPIPLLAAVTARDASDDDGDVATASAPPFKIRLALPRTESRVTIALRLTWGPGADADASGGEHTIEVDARAGASAERTVEVVTQRVDHGPRVAAAAARALGEAEGEPASKRVKTE